ncbi:hypothetical protein HZA44_04280 [Candidatus Peregrinibacteria bacterium]|nr:hypothetical protein [Candidatus Peregrinibacteria bacterium]
MDEANSNTDLDNEYQGLIESHKEYLGKLQSAFDQRCDAIGEETKATLATIPEDDQETRKKILLEEQSRLNQTLAELKQVVTRSNAEVRKKLEEIETMRSAAMMDLESELASIENPKKTK